MYYFSDFDDDIGDLRIAGSEYTALIKLCCAHSEYASLTFTSQEQVKRFSKFLCIENIEPINNAEERRKYRGFFRCSAETAQFLCTHVDEFFEWIDFEGCCNPEDLTFYREDSSVFFWSETHEGICAFFNHEAEDISSLVSNRGWKYHNPQDGNVWGIPAFLTKKTNLDSTHSY